MKKFLASPLGRAILVTAILFLLFVLTALLTGLIFAVGLVFAAGVGAIVYAIYDSRSTENAK